jgi:hypothetical protein
MEVSRSRRFEPVYVASGNESFRKKIMDIKKIAMNDYTKDGTVKLIMGITRASNIEPSEIETILIQQFGTISHQSEWFSFSRYTNYYEPEMGGDLSKCFLGFDRLVPIEGIHFRKLETIELENHWKDNLHNRRVNLDPGYLTLSKLLLFSTKDYAHRIYIGNGIFAEITLSYSQNSFQKGQWTYPDYKSEYSICFFNQVRQDFLTTTRTKSESTNYGKHN